MPLDCGLFCLLTDRRRYIEILWQHRLLVTSDEHKAKRRFLNLMRSFDSEDLNVLRRAVVSHGIDIKQCAPGPPMDLLEETFNVEESAQRRASVVSTNENRRYSTICLEHLGESATFATVHPTNSQLDPSAPSTSQLDISSQQILSQFTPRSNPAINNYKRQHTTISANTTDINSPDFGSKLKMEEATLRPSVSVEERGLIPQIDRPMSMPYLSCKMWRWKDLQVDAALHRFDLMPWCRFGRVTINNSTVSCCNPYHYGLWIRPELLSNSEDQNLSGILLETSMENGNEQTFDTGYRKLNIERPIDNSKKSDIIDKIPPNPLGIAPSASIEELMCESISYDTLMHSSHHNIHSQTIAWGRMSRWECKKRIGEVVPLVGQFVAVGKLAGTVFDGQDVKTSWDIENHASFAIIRQTECENYEDIWLYNSGDRPIFLCITQTLNNRPSSDQIRRLSQGYCLRVYRTQVQPDLIPASNNEINSQTNLEWNQKPTIVNESLLATPPPESPALPAPLPPLPVPSTTTTLKPKSLFTFLTLSIGIGWGKNYQQLYITEVPCRYEIIFD